MEAACRGSALRWEIHKAFDGASQMCTLTGSTRSLEGVARSPLRSIDPACVLRAELRTGAGGAGAEISLEVRTCLTSGNERDLSAISRGCCTIPPRPPRRG